MKPNDDTTIDAELLMLIAGELNADEQESLLRRVAVDDRLRERLEELRRLDADLRGEASISLPASASGLNATLRVVRQAILTETHVKSSAAPQHRRLPRWAFPLAAAAALIAGYGLWMMVDDTPAMLPNSPMVAEAPPDMRSIETLETPQMYTQLASVFEPLTFDESEALDSFSDHYQALNTMQYFDEANQ
jgi:anti-sigma-K factor RskA